LKQFDMERFITALLIDDDSSARNILQKFLEFEDKVLIVASLGNTLLAEETIIKYEPDVIFLDINMPYENGLRFAKRIKESDIETLVVFTTAFKNYALEAFPLKPFDFLVKPFGIDEISILLQKIENYIDSIKFSGNQTPMMPLTDKFRFKTNHGYIFLLPHEIIFIRSIRNYCELYLTSGSVEKIHLPISVISKEFARGNFRMINRSIIINLSYITRIDRKLKKCVVCSNEKEFELPITLKNLAYFENLNALKLG
jgi:DNA-binding LytR/AlgR family response regulator